MKAVKIKSGGQAYILNEGEWCPPNQICLLWDEWEWALRLSNSFKADMEQMRSFWESVLERKKSVPGYVVFMDFPKEPELKKRGIKIQGDTVEILRPGKTTEGTKICGEILEMLKKHKADKLEEC